jgi:hypothetical protein
MILFENGGLGIKKTHLVSGGITQSCAATLCASALPARRLFTSLIRFSPHGTGRKCAAEQNSNPAHLCTKLHKAAQSCTTWRPSERLQRPGCTILHNGACAAIDSFRFHHSLSDTVPEIYCLCPGFLRDPPSFG